MTLRPPASCELGPSDPRGLLFAPMITSQQGIQGIVNLTASGAAETRALIAYQLCGQQDRQARTASPFSAWTIGSRSGAVVEG